MAKRRPLDVEQELLEAFRQNGLITEYLVGAIPDAIWRAKAPSGRGKSIAAIVTHVQGVRRTFARMGGARPGPPALDRTRVTRAQAQHALRTSTETLASLFADAIVARRSRVGGMSRRLVNMLMYLVEHDAHHRGQICMLAKDLGHEFRSEDVMRMWGWKPLQTPRTP